MVMSFFPFDRYKVSVMTVERPSKSLKRLLSKHGYFYKHDHHPELFLHETFDKIQTLMPQGRYDFKDPNRVD